MFIKYLLNIKSKKFTETLSTLDNEREKMGPDIRCNGMSGILSWNCTMRLFKNKYSRNCFIIPALSTSQYCCDGYIMQCGWKSLLKYEKLSKNIIIWYIVPATQVHNDEDC